MQNVGLWQGDDLSCLYQISGLVSDKIWKDIIRNFRENLYLKITILNNLKIVNFLHITFDLYAGRYQPYKKPNNTRTYIKINSNYLSNITEALPDSISKRVGNISSDKATHDDTAPFYNGALSTSGYKRNLGYQKDVLPPKIER